MRLLDFAEIPVFILVLFFCFLFSLEVELCLLLTTTCKWRMPAFVFRVVFWTLLAGLVIGGHLLCFVMIGINVELCLIFILI